VANLFAQALMSTRPQPPQAADVAKLAPRPPRFVHLRPSRTLTVRTARTLVLSAGLIASRSYMGSSIIAFRNSRMRLHASYLRANPPGPPTEAA